MEDQEKKIGEPEKFETSEISALSSSIPEAMTVFYRVAPALALADTKEAAWDLYEDAMCKLRELLKDNPQSEHDLARMDLLLLRRMWTRIKSLEPTRENGENLALQDLKADEALEIASLQDRRLVGVASELYGNALLQMDSAPRELIMDVYEQARIDLANLYRTSLDNDNDLSKWDIMLTRRLFELSKKWNGFD